MAALYSSKKVQQSSGDMWTESRSATAAVECCLPYSKFSSIRKTQRLSCQSLCSCFRFWHMLPRQIFLLPLPHLCVSSIFWRIYLCLKSNKAFWRLLRMEKTIRNPQRGSNFQPSFVAWEKWPGNIFVDSLPNAGVANVSNIISVLLLSYVLMMSSLIFMCTKQRHPGQS